MRALAVEFAPEPPWKRRALWVLLGISCLCAAAACWHAWGTWQKLSSAQRELAGLQTQWAQREQLAREQEAQLAIPKPYAKDAIAILRVASFPADQVLHALEATQVEGVRVTSIDLNPEAATARAELEFADEAQLMRYLEEINAGEEKPRWVLQQAKMVPPGHGGTASLLSSWASQDSSK